MYIENRDTIRLNELVHWVKKELLSDEAQRNDPVPYFVIDEVTVEVNFVLSGEGEGSFDLHVVKAGAKVAEERVQKAIVRMKPIVSHDELTAEFAERHPQIRRKIVDNSVKLLLKGREIAESNEGAVAGDRT